MASKKCPKCGEDNPAEAVMCWACYTPLTGSAPIAAGIGAAGSVRPGAAAAAAKTGQIGSPTQEEGTKKEIDPKMLVVGGLLVLGVVLAVVMNSGMLSGTEDDGTSTSTATDPAGTRPAQAPPVMPVNPGGGAPQMGTAPQIGSGGTVPPAQALPYNVVVPPNPKYATGTLGILATQQNLSQAQAGGLAKFARDQFARNGKWTGMQIAVFSDPAAAKQFASYQAKRRGAPLNANDYQQLANTNIWMGAPAFYQSSGKKETISYPSRNPMNWWSKAG